MSTDIVAADVAARLDDLRIVTITDGEVWSARDLQPFAGYAAWQDFSRAINRAIESVNASGLDASDHFRGVPKLIEAGKGAKRQIEDVELTRYGCYILFQNADARKPEIAALQQYFAVQTRRQETAAAALSDDEIVARALQIQTERVAALTDRLAHVEPRAEAWDAIASAEGDYSVGDAAKMLARAGVLTGPTRLFNQLADLGWIFRGEGGAWRAYAHRVDKGYLAEKPTFHYHPSTGERVVDPPQVRVTVRGVDRLRQRLTQRSAVTA